jgi:hypothetical protein
VTLTREELTAALEAATRDLAPHEKVAVYERVATEVARANRRTRYPTPGALAHRIDPLVTIETPALELIDRELVAATQRMESGEAVRLGIFAPPQEGKSRRVTMAFPLWLLLRNPDLRIALVSSSPRPRPRSPPRSGTGSPSTAPGPRSTRAPWTTTSSGSPCAGTPPAGPGSTSPRTPARCSPSG